MSRRTAILFAASVIVAIGSTATVSTDALAKKAVHHRAPAAVVVATVPPPAPAPVVLIDNNYGPVAERIPHCIDSVIFYPYPPCY
jgi:hypothetical protein